jgi:hypothetical protein
VDIWKRLAELSNIASAAIAIILLFKQRGEPLPSQVPTQTPDHPPLVILCIVVVSSSLLNSMALQRMSSALIKQKPAGAILSGGIPQPSAFGSPAILPDGRKVISCSLEDLLVAYNDMTKDQFNRLLAGKWIKLTGKMKDNDGNGQVTLASDSAIIRLQFGKGWEESLAVLRRGSSMTIRGKIVDVGDLAIRFADCELL